MVAADSDESIPPKPGPMEAYGWMSDDAWREHVLKARGRVVRPLSNNQAAVGWGRRPKEHTTDLVFSLPTQDGEAFLWKIPVTYREDNSRSGGWNVEDMKTGLSQWSTPKKLQRLIDHAALAGDESAALYLDSFADTLRKHADDLYVATAFSGTPLGTRGEFTLLQVLSHKQSWLDDAGIAALLREGRGKTDDTQARLWASTNDLLLLRAAKSLHDTGRADDYQYLSGLLHSVGHRGLPATLQDRWSEEYVNANSDIFNTVEPGALVVDSERFEFLRNQAEARNPVPGERLPMLPAGSQVRNNLRKWQKLDDQDRRRNQGVIMFTDGYPTQARDAASVEVGKSALTEAARGGEHAERVDGDLITHLVGGDRPFLLGLEAYDDHGILATEDPNQDRPVEVRVLPETATLRDAFTRVQEARRLASPDSPVTVFWLDKTRSFSLDGADDGQEEDLDYQRMKAGKLRSFVEGLHASCPNIDGSVKTTFESGPPIWHDLVGLDAEGYPSAQALLGDTDPRHHSEGWRYVMVPLSATGTRLKELAGADSRIAEAIPEDAYFLDPGQVGIDREWESGQHKDAVLIDEKHPPQQAGVLIKMPIWHFHPALSFNINTGKETIETGDSILDKRQQGKPAYLHSSLGRGTQIIGVIAPQDANKGAEYPLNAWDNQWAKEYAETTGLPLIKTAVLPENGIRPGHDENGLYVDIPTNQTGEGGRYQLTGANAFRTVEDNYQNGLLISPPQLGRTLEAMKTQGVSDDELRSIAAGFERTVTENQKPRLTLAPSSGNPADYDIAEITVHGKGEMGENYGRSETKIVINKDGAYPERLHADRWEDSTDPEACHPKIVHDLIQEAYELYPHQSEQIAKLYNTAKVKNATQWAIDQRMGGRISPGVMEIAEKYAGSGNIDWLAIQGQAQRATAEGWAKVSANIAAATPEAQPQQQTGRADPLSQPIAPAPTPQSGEAPRRRWWRRKV